MENVQLQWKSVKNCLAQGCLDPLVIFAKRSSPVQKSPASMDVGGKLMARLPSPARARQS
jgi:hypothetical protein